MSADRERLRSVRRRVGSHLQRSRSAAAAFARLSRLLALPRSDRTTLLAHRIVERGPRLVKTTVRYDGVRFDVDLRDNLQRTLFYLGHYERPLHELLVSEIRAGDVVIDVGANVGVHALPIARRLTPLGGRVIAFEASAASAAELRRNAARNDLAVDVQELALGRGRSTAVLRSSPRWDVADLGVRSVYGEGEPVESVEVWSFDDWVADRALTRLDVVKIDVEGAEFDVLVGMADALRRLRPRLVVVEVIEYFLTLAGTTSTELDAFLSDLGYVIAGPSVAEIVAGPTDGLWPNAVYRRTAD